MSEPNRAPEEYEFSDVQNQTLITLASAMKFVAIVEIIIGAVNAVAGVLALLSGSIGNLIVYGVTSVITIVLALMLSTASNHFRNIVDTQGDDVTHLMGALEELRKYFVMKKVLYIIAIILFVAALAFVFLLGMRSAVHQ